MVKKLNQQTFTEDVLQSDVPVLVDFYADWCGPCKMMAPILDAVADELGDRAKIYKVNVDECMDLSREYRIMNIPAMFIFKNGEVVEKVIGASQKSNLITLLEKHM